MSPILEGSFFSAGMSFANIWLLSANVSISVISPLSRPPSPVKNLKPLRFHGRWLAVIITAPSVIYSGKTVLMNIAGVEEREASRTLTPYGKSACWKFCSILSPDSLESRPKAMVISEVFLPVDKVSQYRNPLAILVVVSPSILTASPGTPSSAIPLMSLPFCNLL